MRQLILLVAVAALFLGCDDPVHCPPCAPSDAGSCPAVDAGPPPAACPAVCRTEPNTTATCDAGLCEALECAAGWFDCNRNLGRGDDGCESSFDCPWRRVFLSSTTTNGSLGGRDGADARCQSLAQAANLGGAWKAWLGAGNTGPANDPSWNRVAPAGFARLDGVLVATGWADLVDGALLAPINVTELGSGGPSIVWTAAGDDGLPAVCAPSMTGTNNCDCDAWTMPLDSISFSSYNAEVGSSAAMDASWTSASSQGCSNMAALYCFEQ